MTFTPDELLKAGGAIIAAIIAGFFAWVAGNRTGRAAFITATSEAADKVIARYEAMVKTLASDIEHLSHKVEACEDKHRECEAKVADLTRLVSDGPSPRKQR